MKINNCHRANHLLRLTILLLCSVVWINCRSNSSSSCTTNYLTGTTWISSTFLTKLKQTKNSNIAAQGINLSMLEFSDSTHGKVIWNFYEGTDFSYTIRQDTVELTDLSNRRYGQLVFFDKDSVLFDSKMQSFTKCDKLPIIESSLFAGRYRADSTQQLVTFLPIGSVQNFHNYQSYTCDFRNALLDSSLNIMYLDDLKFAYQFQENGDLEIFELVCSDISDDETCVKGKRMALLRRYD